MSRLPFAACTLALALGACRQTVLFAPSVDAGGGRSGGAGGIGGGGAGGSAAGGTGGTGGPFLPDGGPCRRLDYTVESPDVVVALDRSASMSAPIGLTTKLEMARQALAEAARQYRAVHFGYVGFPGSSFGCLDPGCCPTEVLPPTKDADRFQRELYACDVPASNCAFGSQRPTAAALQASLDLFLNFDKDLPGRHVLLVTDGDPSCSNSSPNACADAERQVSMLGNLGRDQGVRTKVIGVGPPSNDICLRTRLGVFQGGGYYPISADALDATVDAITREIARNACHLDVDSVVIDPNRIVLLRDRSPVPRDGPGGGWDLDQMGALKITLRGGACETMMTEGPGRFELVEGCQQPRP